MEERSLPVCSAPFLKAQHPPHLCMPLTTVGWAPFLQLKIKKMIHRHAKWCMSVIPDIQEAKTGILQDQGLPERLSEILAQKKKEDGWERSLVMEYVIKMSKALGSTLSATKLKTRHTSLV